MAGFASERATQPGRICELCVSMLGISGAGISLVTTTGAGLVCATDAVSARMEDLQLTLGEGPSVDAALSGSPVLVPDLQEPDDIAVERWLAFLEGARLAGAGAMFAFPLRIGAITIGVLHLYRRQPGDLDDEQLAAALKAAHAAALALLHLGTGQDGTFTDDFDAHSTHQLQVHQATGMVQAQLNVRTEDALLMLRARAFSRGQSVGQISTEVVERRLRFSTEDL